MWWCLLLLIQNDRVSIFFFNTIFSMLKLSLFLDTSQMKGGRQSFRNFVIEMDGVVLSAQIKWINELNNNNNEKIVLDDWWLMLINMLSAVLTLPLNFTVNNSSVVVIILIMYENTDWVPMLWKKNRFN